MKREFVTAPKEHQGGDEGVETHEEVAWPIRRRDGRAG